MSKLSITTSRCLSSTSFVGCWLTLTVKTNFNYCWKYPVYGRNRCVFKVRVLYLSVAAHSTWTWPKSVTTPKRLGSTLCWETMTHLRCTTRASCSRSTSTVSPSETLLSKSNGIRWAHFCLKTSLFYLNVSHLLQMFKSNYTVRAK